MAITILGCKIHYEMISSADSNAPTILFLHGWGCDTTIFSPIVSDLMKSATIITLDFPGHGQSDDPPVSWDVSAYANMVFLLLTELKQTQVHIIAHSFGGRVALALANRHPDLIRKIVITGGAGIKKTDDQTLNKRTKRFKEYNKMLNTLKHISFLQNVIENLQKRLRNHFGSSDYIKLNERMRETFVKVISEDLTPILASIAVPVLLIWGSKDSETPLWMGQRMEQTIPDAGLVIFEDRGHFAFLEEYQRFILIVRQFFLDGKG